MVAPFYCRKPQTTEPQMADGGDRVTTSENNKSGKFMAADDERPKSKEKTPPKEKTSVDAPAKDKTPAEAKNEAKAEVPKDYSRGEGQKAVTQAYKDNWNAIYGKKKKRKR